MAGSEASRLAVNHPTGQYDVIVGRKLLPELVSLAGITGPMAIVTDSHVGPLYADKCGAAVCYATMPAGEQHKTLATVEHIYGRLLEAGIDRSGTIVSLGGGVVGDVAGFVAATFMRGIDFVQCPTSLLAMVDASVGAKTGVDLPQGKNLVGAFKQPAAVIADLSTLQTLPAEEFAAGMAEVVKHGLIAAPGLLSRLERDNRRWETLGLKGDNGLQSLVTEAIQVKRDVVQEDPFEQGRRAALNLGHTFAHAIELVSRYSIRHGEAVAMGLVAATHLSARLGHCPLALQDRIEGILTRLNLPIRVPGHLVPSAIIEAMGTDKKRAAGKQRFVLIRGVGNVFMTDDVPPQAVAETLVALTGRDNDAGRCV